MDYEDLKAQARVDGLGLRWLAPLVEVGSTRMGDMEAAAYGHLEDCAWSQVLEDGPMLGESGRIRSAWAKGFGAAARRLAEAGLYAGPESDPELWASWLAWHLSEPHEWLKSKAEGVKTTADFVQAEIEAVLRRLSDGELPSVLPGRGRRYLVADRTVHVKFQGRTPSKADGRFPFAINRVTLASDLAVWICGDRSTWYCIPTETLRGLVNTPGAYKGRRTDETWLVHLDEATHEVAYAAGATMDFASWFRGDDHDGGSDDSPTEAHLYVYDRELRGWCWCAHVRRTETPPWFELIEHDAARFTVERALEVTNALAGPTSVMVPVDAPDGVLADGVRTSQPGDPDHFADTIGGLHPLMSRWDRVEDWVNDP